MKIGKNDVWTISEMTWKHGSQFKAAWNTKANAQRGEKMDALCATQTVKSDEADTCEVLHVSEHLPMSGEGHN